MLSKKLLSLTAIGLMSLSLLGCSTQSVIKEYVYVNEQVPETLLDDCPGYSGPITTNGELANAYLAEKQGRILCNTDKQFLRDWLKSRPTN